MTPTSPTDLNVSRPHQVLFTSATAGARIVPFTAGSNAKTSLADGSIVSEASTRRATVPRNVERELQYIFAQARYEVFEDGVTSEFGRRLQAAIRVHGNSALLEMNALLRDPTTSKNVAAESLRVLGRVKDRHTH